MDTNGTVWVTSIQHHIAMNVSQKLRRQTCQRVFKYILIGGLIFAISFSACKNYLLRNAGYPPTFEPSQPAITVSYPNILNASVVEILQDIKSTPAFSILDLLGNYFFVFIVEYSAN
ncbi:MAG: hypothetical protein FWC33_06495 [Candidatus Bathyarchaeota archaeon]|nr:hypothetical protein [Candidatus Termiticorpusculum sp.]